jgi:hypothetical protein
MTVSIETELPMSGQMVSGMQTSIDKTSGFEHDTYQHDNFTGPPRADIPSWLMSDDNLCLSTSNHQLREMEAGQSNHGVTRPGSNMPSSACIKSERQAPRRSSRKMIGPATLLDEEEKIFNHRLTSDLDQTRNIRIALIIGLLVVLLGILICVILTILVPQLRRGDF